MCDITGIKSTVRKMVVSKLSWFPTERPKHFYVAGGRVVSGFLGIHDVQRQRG